MSEKDVEMVSEKEDAKMEDSQPNQTSPETHTKEQKQAMIKERVQK